MAGDWIKMECCTPEKSEVLAMTAILGWDEPDLTVGKLFRLWRWFDQQTLDGNARGVTSALLDRVIGVSGFCAAMAEVGWLVINDDGISLPNFNRHNGSTAKNRAVTAKRVAAHRSNAGSNAAIVTAPLAREEKRREEVIHTPPTPIGVVPPKPRAVRKCPESFEVTADLADWAAREVPAVNANAETAKFRDHTFKTAISDWPAAWRNWLRKAAEFGPKGVVRPESFKERDARAAAERYAVLTGGLAHDKKALAPLPFERGYSETIEVIPNEQRQIAG